MSDKGASSTIRIDLTPVQAQTVKEATGREATAIELTAAELEQRIVPNMIAAPTSVASPDALAANSNESLLVG